MKNVNWYPVSLWHEISANRLTPKYRHTKLRFAQLLMVISEYWQPGQRNSDRLLRECRERALKDVQTSHLDYDE